MLALMQLSVLFCFFCQLWTNMRRLRPREWTPLYPEKAHLQHMSMVDAVSFLVQSSHSEEKLPYYEAAQGQRTWLIFLLVPALHQPRAQVLGSGTC